MATICEKIINPNVTVTNTSISVYNWGSGGNNVDHVWLEFSDGSHIGYAVDMQLDLPNGEYELIDGNYIKINNEDTDEEAIEAGRVARLALEMESKVLELIDYIKYLIESSERYKIDTKELVLLLQDLTIDTYDKIMNEAERISSIINNKVNNILDSQSENIVIIKAYFSYLKEHTDKIFNSFDEIVSDANFDFVKEQMENFANNLEKMENFLRSNN